MNLKNTYFIVLLLCLNVSIVFGQKVEENTDNLTIDSTLEAEIEPIIIEGIRAGNNAPIAFSNFNKEEINKKNLGQDIPVLLNSSPSLIMSSDAGAGVGYTSMRIRGSDQTRINVTINGIPYNDPESQGVFWVNLPDISSSASQIQVQRGLGTSTNGPGAFGGSVHLHTQDYQSEAYGQFSSSYGSYNTRRQTLKLGTGLLASGFSIDGRLSMIDSDGYVERATSDLASYYLSGTYVEDRTVIRAITFSGHERTYQSWYGTPAAVALEDEIGIQRFIDDNFLSEAEANRLREEGRRYNFYTYENEVDDYGQDHYQLHWTQEWTSDWSMKMSGFYTHGAGFFEQFRGDDDFSEYGLSNPIVNGQEIESGQFIRRRWLDNDYYGLVLNNRIGLGSINNQLNIGGSWTQYDGDHFGEIIWAEFASDLGLGDRYYDNVGKKSDVNVYAKLDYSLSKNLSMLGDMQYRRVVHEVSGVDSDLRDLDFERSFDFFNPKIGLRYDFLNSHSFYTSFGIGNREPDRNDLVDSDGINFPEHETLRDLEIGYRHRNGTTQLEAGLYYMDYKNQLVLTGALNDVGSTIRTNVPDSYRLGMELMWNVALMDQLTWSGNVNFSRNKIANFTEVISPQEIVHEDTDISFSPSVVSSTSLEYSPVAGLQLGWHAKYIGRQYLDNTSNMDRSIPSSFVNDFYASYSFERWGLKQLSLKLLVNNLLNAKYQTFGYTYSYFWGDDLFTENFYYPQAERNILMGVTVDF